MIVITLEGGLIQGISSDDPAEVGKEVVILDYDSEGADPEEVSLIPQDDDSSEEAIISRQEIGVLFKPIAEFLHAELKKDGHEKN
jgi:hypothetical protein